MLEGTDRAGARQLAERIRAGGDAAELRVVARGVQATLSLGVASYPDDAREKAEIIARADQALYAREARRPNRDRLLRATSTRQRQVKVAKE